MCTCLQGRGRFPQSWCAPRTTEAVCKDRRGLSSSGATPSVAQDCRGKYDSEGQFTPLVNEAADGNAALDWVAGQSWCNGRVGLWGRSYLGIVQMPAAAGGHEVLMCGVTRR